MRDAIVGYLETVIRVEWPAQAEGLVVDRGKAYLEKLNALANGLKPVNVADGNLHAQLLQSLALWDARQQRLLAAETTVPTVVWIVTLFGGGLTIAFGSFLGVSQLPGTFFDGLLERALAGQQGSEAPCPCQPR